MIHFIGKLNLIILLSLFIIFFKQNYAQQPITWNYCENSPCPNPGNYTLSGGHLNKSELKYYFYNGTDDINGEDEKSAFVSAFDTWANAIPFTFIETFTEAEADIYIKFITDGNEWRSAYNIESAIAVSWLPNAPDCAGKLFLNNWYHSFTLEPGQSSKDLQAVTLHEIGHVLGLCHSSNTETVMYGFQQNPNKRTLHTYDIQGIQAIYASVIVKNEFENPDQTTTNGGIINVEVNPNEFRDFSTDNLANNAKAFAFPRESERRFEAKEQTFQNIDRKFNSYDIYNGGWLHWNGNAWNRVTNTPVFDQQIFSGIYKAQYLYKTMIGLNALTEFNGTISTGLSIGEIYQYEAGDITAPEIYQPAGSNINYNFSYWTDNYSAQRVRSVVPVENTSYTGLYKYKQHSNSTNGFSTNSQQKFVKTDDGFLHYVYESMGMVWYELSTDAGNTWTIMNNGKPLSTMGKSPSIDFRNNFVLIAYQGEGSVYVNSFLKDVYSNNYYLTDNLMIDEFSSLGMDYAQNSYPVIAIGGGAYWEGFFFILTWRIYQGETPGWQPYGLYCKLGKIFPPDYSINWANSDYSQLICQSLVSQNPSVVVNKVDYNAVYNLVWQEDRTIKYNTLIPRFETPQNVQFSSPIPLSTTSGYTFNSFPSISLSSNNTPIISWVGKNGSGIEKNNAKEEGGTPTNTRKVVIKNGISGNYFNGGDNVNYVNSNSTSSGDYSVFIWSEGTSPISKWVRRQGSRYSTTTNLSYSGILTQVSNGTTISSIKSMAFNNQTSPYIFTFINDNFSTDPEGGGIGKITNDIKLTYGRSGIVGKNGVQFVFNIGDIILADTNVQFIPRPDTILYYNTAQLNEATKSLTFHLNNQSELYFTNYYYTVNPDYADSVLSDIDEVNFKVELVNANTEEIIGTFDEITYSKSNLDEYDNVDYQVDCSSIPEGDYYFRLITSVSGTAEYNLANVQNDNPGLEKRNYLNIDYKGNEIVNMYELFQNYPNPFNPTTIIRYQVPENGFVTLKIYDVLGREVKTLVNNDQNTGQYEVEFDASDLASGIYIYQLKAGQFLASKKMLLVK